MFENHFMGKPFSYWVKLEETFGDVQDDPYVLLAAAEAKLRLLDSTHAQSKQLLLAEIDKRKIEINNGK